MYLAVCDSIMQITCQNWSTWFFTLRNVNHMEILDLVRVGNSRDRHCGGVVYHSILLMSLLIKQWCNMIHVPAVRWAAFSPVARRMSLYQSNRRFYSLPYLLSLSLGTKPTNYGHVDTTACGLVPRLRILYSLIVHCDYKWTSIDDQF